MYLHNRLRIFLFLSTVVCFTSLDAEDLQYSSRFVDTENGSTFQELVHDAEQNNTALQEASFRIQEAIALRKQAGLRPNPELQFSAGTSSIAGESGDHEWSASYAQPLEIGGKRGKRIKVSDFAVQIAKEEALNRKRELIAELHKTFAEVLAGAASLRAIEESIDLGIEIHKITAARVDEGEAAAVEKGLTELELNRLRTDAAALESKLLPEQTSLQRITGKLEGGMKIRGELFRKSELETDDLQKLILIGKANRPDLNAAKLSEQAAEAEAELARAEGISDLDAFIGYSSERSKFDQFGFSADGTTVPIEDSDRIVSAGVSLKLPLFSRNQGNVQAAIVRKQAASARKMAIEKSIELEIKLAFDRLQIAKANYEKFKNSILGQAQQQLDIIRAAYQAGEIRLFDLLNQQRSVLATRQAFIEAAKEHYLASVELENATAYSNHDAGDIR